MRKRILTIVGIMLTGTLIGLLSAGLILWKLTTHSWIQNGQWRTNLRIGNTNADMYTRTAIAIGGLFALNKSETMYYVARTDQNGETLRSDCIYRVEGGKLDARWWSLTLYGSTLFLIPNKEHRFSYTRDQLLPRPNKANKAIARPQRWSFAIARQRQPGRWLPSGRESRLTLTLRLYNPGASVQRMPDKVLLPRIVKQKGSCGGGS